jgi:hypothetical protein
MAILNNDHAKCYHTNISPAPSLLCRRCRNHTRRRRRLRHITSIRPRNRCLRRPFRNKATTRTTNFLRPTQSQTNIDASWQSQANVQLPLAHGQFRRARHIVEGVWGGGVVVCVVGRSDVEEHAVCFAVAEGETLGVRFAEGLAGGEGILCARGFEVVGRRGFYVGDNAAAGGSGGGAGLC